MRSLRRVAAAATVLALTAFLAGCGDDDKDGSEPRETVTVDPSDTGSSDAAEITQEQVDAALLTATEVSPDFEDGTWTNEDTPPPCDPTGAPVDETLPPAIESGAQIDHVDGIASYEEEISVYASDAEATEAAGLLTESLNCSEGTLDDGTAFTLSAPEDVTGQVNADGVGTSTAWEVTTDAFQGVLVLTVAGRVVIGNTFAAAPETDTSALPDPISIAASAYEKAPAS